MKIQNFLQDILVEMIRWYVLSGINGGQISQAYKQVKGDSIRIKLIFNFTPLVWLGHTQKV